MLDKRSLALLDILNAECSDSGYKIFSLSDLSKTMPDHFAIDTEGIRECVNALSEREYISLKYEDEREVCLKPLPKGRLVFENRIDEEVEKNRFARKYLIYSFAGSVIGGGAILILALLVYILAGGV